MQIAGDYPPFSYNGARCTKLCQSGEWIHATGDTAVGMTSVKFCGQIWSLAVAGSPYKWKKLEPEVPECDNVRLIVTVSKEKVVYIVDPKAGVSKLQL